MAAFKLGDAVRTVGLPLGEQQPARGRVTGVHEPFDYKGQWERELQVRQTYAVLDYISGASFMFEETDLRPDLTQDRELAGIIGGRIQAKLFNKVGPRGLFKLESLEERAARHHKDPAQRAAFIKAFKMGVGNEDA